MTQRPFHHRGIQRILDRRRLTEIEAIPDEAIDLSDIPEAGAEFFDQATFRRSAALDKDLASGDGAGPERTETPMSDTTTAPTPAIGHNSELKPGERLEAAMDRWLQLDARKKRIERLLKLQAEEMARLVVNEIPTILREMGTSESTGPSGRAKARTGVKVAGSLQRSPDPQAALNHLRENGFDAALAGKLVIDFLPDEEPLARQVLAEVAEEHGKEGTFEQTVHPSTLAAWARAKLAEGTSLDIELLGLTAWTEAKVTPLKGGR